MRLSRPAFFQTCKKSFLIIGGTPFERESACLQLIGQHPRQKYIVANNFSGEIGLLIHDNPSLRKVTLEQIRMEAYATHNIIDLRNNPEPAQVKINC